MKSTLRALFITLGLSLFLAHNPATAQSYTLKKNQISRQGKNLCILVKNKWIAGKKVGSKYAKNPKGVTGK